MIRDIAAAVNAASTLPPVPPFHRWRCPKCGAAYRHPWSLATHLATADPRRPDHGLTEIDAWTLAATVAPVDISPGLDRYPAVPPIPMDPPPALTVYDVPGITDGRPVSHARGGTPWTELRKAVAHAG